LGADVGAAIRVLHTIRHDLNIVKACGQENWNLHKPFGEQ
jgi:hypothetical protein